MDSTMLNVILWIPFGLVFLITAIVYMITGYKRGIWRALLSVAATAVSAVLSMLLARLIAPLCAATISGSFSMGNMQGASTLVSDLVQAAVGMVLAMVLYSTFMFVITIIMKTISHEAGEGKLLGQKKWQKWAGMGVRLVDAAIYSLLLVLPLYGTLAAYGPTAQVLIKFQDDVPAKTQEYLEVAVEHPVVKASRSAPTAWLYGELSAVEIGGDKVDIAAVASSAEGIATRMEALSNASEEERLPMVKEIIAYTRENVIEQDWCYDLVINQMLGMVKQAVEENASAEERVLVDEILAICDISKEQFRENADQLLGFAEYMLENQLIDQDLEVLMNHPGFISQLGDLVNSTEQAVAMKNMLIRIAVQENLFHGNGEQAESFVKEHIGNTPTDPALRQQEARAMIAMLAADSIWDMAQALEMHPAFNGDVMNSWMENGRFIIGY